MNAKPMPSRKPKADAIQWSAEQLAIFEHFGSGTGNAEVRALAGSGKTTTIKAAFEYAPEARILYAVFNKKNQVEAEAKIKDPRVDVRTLHSLGLFFLRKAWRNVVPDDNVEYDRINAVLSAEPILKADKEFCGTLFKLVGFLKNTTIGNATRADAEQAMEQQDLSLGSMWHDEKLATAALLVLEASKTKDPQGRASFNDFVWLPVVLKLVRPIYNLVVIDEAQDMNLPQLTMARQACREGGRVVVVGDENQAIYGFRGAVKNGMGMMRAILRAKTFTLTESYRNPKAVAQLVVPIISTFRVPASAIEGKVEHCQESALLPILKEGDAVLSRTNAPLFPLALSLLRKNIPCRIEGRDIGKQLLAMARSLKAKSVPHFLEKLRAWEAKQIQRVTGSKNEEKKLEQIHDIAETLSVIAESSKSVQDIEDRLNNLFGGIYTKEDEAQKRDAIPCVLLSSVHKAKGLEWWRVFLLSETFRQNRGGEELNIYYVAITRAKAELYFVGGVKPALPVKNEPAAAQEPAKQPVSDPVKPAQGSKPEDYIQPSGREVDDYDLPAGLQYRKRGQVISWNATEYVVTEVNDCRARAVCLSRSRKVVKFGDKEVEMESGARKIDISATVEPSTILRIMSDEEFQEFLNGNSRGRGDNKTTAGKESSNMKKETKSASAGGKLGGTAAYVRQLHGEGLSKTVALEKAVKKFPVLGSGEHFELRWAAAEKLAKSAKAAAKPVKKAAAGKPAPPTRKPAGKPPVPTKKPAAKAPPVKKPAVPQRPAPAPAPAEQAPVEGETPEQPAE